MPSLDPADEAALVAAAREGNTDAIEALLERYESKVLRFGMQMCRDEQDAQDIAQETLLAAARGLRDFQGRSSLSTWMYTIARSYCLKKRRKSKFAPQHETSLDDEDSVEAKRLMAPGRSPEQAAMDRELEAALSEAIDDLEPMYREVLVLRDVEGLTAPEVSEIVGVSVSAVKSRLHRARASVRSALVPFLEREPERRAPGECPDIVNLFSRNLEGDVGEALCEKLQNHVGECPRCKQTCNAIERVVQMCRTRSAPAVPNDLRDAVQEAVRDFQSNSPTGSFK